MDLEEIKTYKTRVENANRLVPWDGLFRWQVWQMRTTNLSGTAGMFYSHTFPNGADWSGNSQRQNSFIQTSVEPLKIKKITDLFITSFSLFPTRSFFFEVFYLFILFCLFLFQPFSRFDPSLSPLSTYSRKFHFQFGGLNDLVEPILLQVTQEVRNI